MNKGIVKVNLDFIAPFLFGPDATIINARPSFDGFGAPVFELVVSHPDIPSRKAGELLPEVTVTVQEDNGKRYYRFAEILR